MYKTQFNPAYSPDQGEPCLDRVSVTIPDMNLTVRELLDNHSRGMDMDVTERIPNYSETEIPRFDDITDRQAWKDELIQRQRDLEATLSEEEKLYREEHPEPKKEPENGSKQTSILDPDQQGDKGDEKSTIQT